MPRSDVRRSMCAGAVRSQGLAPPRRRHGQASRGRRGPARGGGLLCRQRSGGCRPAGAGRAAGSPEAWPHVPPRPALRPPRAGVPGPLPRSGIPEDAAALRPHGEPDRRAAGEQALPPLPAGRVSRPSATRGCACGCRLLAQGRCPRRLLGHGRVAFLRHLSAPGRGAAGRRGHLSAARLVARRCWLPGAQRHGRLWLRTGYLQGRPLLPAMVSLLSRLAAPAVLGEARE
mmetsp:Transcript_1555/g.5291  ORF Transcript_1555/g.5291 Transcript_1555/m.5291 type:complete len:230 (+) Transcript_1555:485-1174(+)